MELSMANEGVGTGLNESPLNGSALPLLAERRRIAFRWGRERPRGTYRQLLKENVFWIFFISLCIAAVISICVLSSQNIPKKQLLEIIELESIPIVSVIFTWGHIWLAIQMMFYPIKFRGPWNFRGSGYGIGWQGVVPRKAGIMAEKTCDLMLGRLIAMEEIIDRFQMDAFFQTLGNVLLDCQRSVNEKLGAEYFPSVWSKLPPVVKDEMLKRVMETQRESFDPIMKDLRENITNILNFKDMAVKRYTHEPTLLIALFQQCGKKEFQFIQRVGAQMGLLLGFAQMGLYFQTKAIPWMPWVLLPVSGLIIGNLTNWLAIKMIFRPLYPHHFCGGGVTIQGLFLKRQKQVSIELASMLTDSCVNAEQMIKYLVSSPGYEGAIEIMHRHTSKACDEMLGYARKVMPMAIGAEGWSKMKKDVVESLLEELPKHSSHFLTYLDQVLQIEETIATRLSDLPPDQFEGMLHPAFDEDEWMLITLGGVLGVVVGLLQAAVLGQ